MKQMRTLLLFVTVLCSFVGFSQESISELLDKYNHSHVPYITVQELAMPKTNALILDVREAYEYKTSHIKNAVFVGYDTFKIDSVQGMLLNKDEKIAVYCSVGIRSEKIALQLKKAGYTNVYNLYGGIFEWKNNGFKVFDAEEKETENVHVSSKYWAKWLIKGNKVY